MNITDRMKIMSDFKTGELYSDIHTEETVIQSLLTEQAAYRTTNSNFIAARGNECKEAQDIELEVKLSLPATDEAGKKLTIEQREVALARVLKIHEGYQAALTKQREVDAHQIDLAIRIDSAIRRRESLLAVLRLRTAQIMFLAGARETLAAS